MFGLLIKEIFVLLVLKTIPALLLSSELHSTIPGYELSSTDWLAGENKNTLHQEFDISYVTRIRMDQRTDEERNIHQIARKEPSIYPKTESEKKGGKVQPMDYIVFVMIGIFFFVIITFLIIVSKTCVIKSMNGRRGILRKTQYRPSNKEERVTPSPCKGIFHIS